MDCVVCLDRFNRQVRRPLVLACGHSTCAACINDILKIRGVLECPTCRVNDAKSIEELPVNFSLLDVIETLSRSRGKRDLFEPRSSSPPKIFSHLPPPVIAGASIPRLEKHCTVKLNPGAARYSQLASKGPLRRDNTGVVTALGKAKDENDEEVPMVQVKVGTGKLTWYKQWEVLVVSAAPLWKTRSNRTESEPDPEVLSRFEEGMSVALERNERFDKNVRRGPLDEKELGVIQMIGFDGVSAMVKGPRSSGWLRLTDLRPMSAVSYKASSSTKHVYTMQTEDFPALGSPSVKTVSRTDSGAPALCVVTEPEPAPEPEPERRPRPPARSQAPSSSTSAATERPQDPAPAQSKRERKPAAGEGARDQPVEPAPSVRLEVGMRVMLAEDRFIGGNLGQGALKRGEVGVILSLNPARQKAIVQAASGEGRYPQESLIPVDQAASMSTPDPPASLPPPPGLGRAAQRPRVKAQSPAGPVDTETESKTPKRNHNRPRRKKESESTEKSS